jgi:hypothetical protein
MKPAINRKVLAIGAATLVAIGAFLAWGPIGLGNGPAHANANYSVVFGTDAGMTPVALTGWLTGPDSWRADSIEFIPPAGYRAPRILAVLAISENLCDGGGVQWLRRADSDDFLLTSCTPAPRTFGPLIGPALGSGRLANPGLGAEVQAPPLAGCWAASSLVIRYHVGIRSYAATTSYRVAVCGASATKAKLTAAANAAGGIGS